MTKHPDVLLPTGVRRLSIAEQVTYIKGMTHLSKNVRNKMIHTLLAWADLHKGKP